MTDPVAVELAGISKTYPSAAMPALDRVDLDIKPGSFFSMLGPSGCGKTTLLRIIAGFEYPSHGRVVIGGRDVTGLSPRERDIAMVFQDYALYPHMSVAQNVAFNLKNSKVPKTEASRRVAEVAEKLGIQGLLDKKPGQLSGGERQRVALGRALVRQPRVFLLDEPLSNLDLKLREAMRIELGRLHQEFGVTTIYVTHDQTEALTLSTELAIMCSGHLQQVGTPDEVYARPTNVFVARFIGSPSMNLFRMSRHGDRFVTEGGRASLPSGGWDVPDGTRVIVGVRPHDLRVDANGGGIPVRVALTEHLGRNNYVICVPFDGGGWLHEQEAIQVETPPAVFFEPGETITVSAAPEALCVFDPSEVALPPASDTPVDGHVASAQG